MIHFLAGFRGPIFTASFVLGAFIGGGAFAQSTTADFAFRDAADTPPADYDWPVFELSHDYPPQDPSACGIDDCTWFFIDVDFISGEPVDWETDPWNDYIMAFMDVVVRDQDFHMSK